MFHKLGSAILLVLMISAARADDAQIIKSINIERQRARMPPVVYDADLDAAAQALCEGWVLNGGLQPTNATALALVGPPTTIVIGYYPKASWWVQPSAVGSAAARVNLRTPGFAQCTKAGSHVIIIGDFSYWVVLTSN